MGAAAAAVAAAAAARGSPFLAGDAREAAAAEKKIDSLFGALLRKSIE